MGDFFDAIYCRFVLRDLASKIVPGAITISGVLLITSLAGVRFPRNPSVPIWLLMFGVAWITGLAVQALGELTGWIEFFPESDVDGEVSADTYRERRLRAHRTADARESQELERFLVLKEASGIGAVAFGLFAACAIIWFALRSWSWPEIAIPVTALVIAALLTWIHRHLVKVEWDYMKTVLKVGPPANDVKDANKPGLAGESFPES